MNSDQVPEPVQDIVEKIVSKYKPQTVILFGSYAWGNPRPDSDVDLLIVKDTSDRPIDRWVEVRRILSDPNRRLPLETLVLTPQEIADRLAIGDQFVAEIVEEGKVLYAA